jgi:predicted membrane protein
MVPTVELPPVTLFTLQATAAFEVLVTVAVNCWSLLTMTWAVGGEMVTTTGFTVTEAFWDELSYEAVIVT